MFYGSAEEFKQYLTARNREVSDNWSDEDIEAALLVASEWLDNQYEDSWIGYKNTYEQERSWPRQLALVRTFPYYTYQNDEIPIEVNYATYEAADRQLNNPGCLQTDYTPKPYNSVSIYNAVTVEYVTGTSAGDVQVQIPAIQGLMSKLLDPEKAGQGNSLYGKAVRA